MDRCGWWKNLRMAAIITGIPRASPTASGNKPNASANHGTVEKTITARAATQIQIPRKKVRRKPMASVSAPTSNVTTVMLSPQAATMRRPAGRCNETGWRATA